MNKSTFDNNIKLIKMELGEKSPVIVKNFFMGQKNWIEAVIIYIKPLVNKDIINRDILTPLMMKVDEDILPKENLADFICKKYITLCNTSIEKDIEAAVEAIKSGETVILIKDLEDFIIADTVGGVYRSISDPQNESAIKGSREGFVENLEVNIGILKRNIKDKSLSIEYFKVGRRGQNEVAIVYIEDIVDKDILEELRKRIEAVDVDFINDTGMLKQYIEDSAYSVFPQAHGTERPDIIKANIMEGRIGILFNGAPYVFTVPAVFVEFFQAVEDYNQRTIVTCFSRILRLIAVFFLITLPSLYLTLIQYNVELIPIKFITPIIQSRKGISLTPFLEILTMEIVVEFLREGGLRLPPRIGQTLSIVGGIIIGNTAVESKIVSPTTLLVVGISVVCSFLIPNYEMSLSLRFIRFPMLFAAASTGFLGIAAGWFFLIIHICSLKSFGNEYFRLTNNDLKDIFIRAPLWKMNKRPDCIPDNNKTRQSNFRRKFLRKNNG